MTQNKVYCAGPLFSSGEKREMETIAEVLELAGYTTFLPQRDGLEGIEILPRLLERGLDQHRAGAVVNRAIFSYDVYQLCGVCSATVANLNGRVPDEGTVVEAALTWMSNRPLVLYKHDARVAFPFGDNPMLTGLTNHKVVQDVDSLPHELAELTTSDKFTVPRHVKQVVEAGQTIGNARSKGDLIGFLFEIGTRNE